MWKGIAGFALLTNREIQDSAYIRILKKIHFDANLKGSAYIICNTRYMKIRRIYGVMMRDGEDKIPVNERLHSEVDF